VTHGRGRGEAGHAPEHDCDGGGGACGGGGSRVCGGGESGSAGLPARIRVAAAELSSRGGRGGSGGRRADRIGIKRWGEGGREGGARRHERMKTEHAFRFGLDWLGFGGRCYFRLARQGVDGDCSMICPVFFSIVNNK
jgi:hypothetical protein